MKKRVPSFDDFLNENVNEGKDPLGLGLGLNTNLVKRNRYSYRYCKHQQVNWKNNIHTR